VPRNTAGLKRGGSPGRPKGRKDDKTLEAEQFARSVIRSPAYRKRLIEQAELGTLAPPIQSMLWAYAYGKPKESSEVTGSLDATVRVLFGGRYKPTNGQGDDE
jgi:hypothetical protein